MLTRLPDRIMLWATYFFILLLIAGKISTYIPPSQAPVLTLFSLLTPVILLVNILLLIYWLIRIKYVFWISLAVILLHYGFVIRLYKINGKKIIRSQDLKVMTYNVRMFNRYKWIPKDSIREQIQEFVLLRSPDVLCLQEYSKTAMFDEKYPYKFEIFENGNRDFGHAIFSKYPIVNRGSFDFAHTANNVLWADIKFKEDTLRIYNVHLQSIGINTSIQHLDQAETKRVTVRLQDAFVKQQTQVEKLLAHKRTCTYPVVIAGDFNNTAFSWAYRKMSEGMQDAFVEAGKGFGRTFRLGLPLRIDFILADDRREVKHFKTYRDYYSDHYPIMARIGKKD